MPVGALPTGDVAMIRIPHDDLVIVPEHGAIFDALMAAHLLMPRGMSVDFRDIFYGVYVEPDDDIEVWMKSEEQWEVDTGRRF